VELVDDDVLSGFEAEPAGHDVLAFTGRIQERYLVGRRADESRVLCADRVGRALHLAERNGPFTLGVDERPSRGGHLARHGRDVGGIQV